MESSEAVLLFKDSFVEYDERLISQFYSELMVPSFPQPEGIFGSQLARVLTSTYLSFVRWQNSSRWKILRSSAISVRLSRYGTKTIDRAYLPNLAVHFLTTHTQTTNSNAAARTDLLQGHTTFEQHQR